MEFLAFAAAPTQIPELLRCGADSICAAISLPGRSKTSGTFSPDDAAYAANLCHSVGARFYVNMPSVFSDNELPAVASLIGSIYTGGADAIRISDFGVLRVIKQCAPTLAIHALPAMNFQTPVSLSLAASAGIKRVILPVNFDIDLLSAMCGESAVEIELPLLGSTCLANDGLCFFSSLQTGQSANRAQCLQPCSAFSSPVRMENRSFVSSLTVQNLPFKDLASLNIPCLSVDISKIAFSEGPRLFKTVIQAFLSERELTEEENRSLSAAEAAKKGFWLKLKMLSKMHRVTSLGKSVPGKIKLDYSLSVSEKDSSVTLSAHDCPGNTASFVLSEKKTSHSAMNEKAVKDILSKADGSPFSANSLKFETDGDICVSSHDIEAAKTGIVNELKAKYTSEIASRQAGTFRPGAQYINRADPPKLIVEITRLEQLSPELIRLPFHYLYVPLHLACACLTKIKPFQTDTPQQVAVVLPSSFKGEDIDTVTKLLKEAYAAGIRLAVANSIALSELARSCGFYLHGNYGLNVCNSQSIKELRRSGFICVTLSPELSFSQIKAISKPIDTEIIAYGRIPMISTSKCVLKTRSERCSCASIFSSLSDGLGNSYPVIKDGSSCGNIIFSQEKLCIDGDMSQYGTLGLRSIRLLFTTENNRECLQIASRFAKNTRYEIPHSFCGMYKKGIK